MKIKKRLFIIGAVNFARELESWLNTDTKAQTDWEIAGFLHYYDTSSPLEGIECDLKIVGDWREFNFTPNDVCIMGITNIEWKQKVYEYLCEKVEFLTYIHPSAIIGKYVKIGKGSIICPNCLVSCNAEVGKCVTINCSTMVGHDTIIGNYCSIMSNVDFGGKVQVGDRVFIGTKATIIPERKICDDVFIGAGSVVIRNIKTSQTVFGNPAQKIK